MTRTKLKALLPRNKCDTERVEKLLALGFDHYAPVIPELLQWLADPNWMVSWPIAEAFSKEGSRLVPFIRPILDSLDRDLVHSVMMQVIYDWPVEVVKQVEPQLQLLTFVRDGCCDFGAIEVLMKHGLLPRERFEQWLGIRRLELRRAADAFDEIEKRYQTVAVPATIPPTT